jgi:hypothetical protein
LFFVHLLRDPRDEFSAIVTGSWDSPIKLWNLNFDDLMAKGYA